MYQLPILHAAKEYCSPCCVARPPRSMIKRYSAITPPASTMPPSPPAAIAGASPRVDVASRLLSSPPRRHLHPPPVPSFCLSMAAGSSLTRDCGLGSASFFAFFTIRASALCCLMYCHATSWRIRSCSPAAAVAAGRRTHPGGILSLESPP